MNFKWTLLLTTLLWTSLCDAQVTWRRTYGGFGSDVGHAGRETPGGDYVICASTGSFDAISGDIYLFKVDVNGDRVWSVILGGSGVEQGGGLEVLSTGQSVLVGTTNSYGQGGYDGYLAIVDGNGILESDRSYGSEDWDFLYDVEPVDDGYFLVGQSFGPGTLGGDVWILRTDLTGDTIWTRYFGTSGVDEGKAIKATPDGGCIVAGTIASLDGYSDAVLLKYDQYGLLQWDVAIGGDSADVGNGVTLVNDGGYVLGGGTKSYSPRRDMLMGKVDASGVAVWTKTIGQIADWEGREIHELSDGRLAMVGYTAAFGGGGKDMYLLFCDSSGDFVSGTTYGGAGEDEGFGLDLTSDNGFLVIGKSRSYGPGIEAVFVVKGDSLGQTASQLVIPDLDPLPVPDLTSSSEQGQLWPSALSPGDPLHLRLNVPPGNAKAQVFDLRGTVVATFPVQQQETTTHLPDLAPGHYSLVVADGGGLTFRSRFIVVQ
jgi:hypothetical protein